MRVERHFDELEPPSVAAGYSAPWLQGLGIAVGITMILGSGAVACWVMVPQTLGLREYHPIGAVVWFAVRAGCVLTVLGSGLAASLKSDVVGASRYALGAFVMAILFASD